MALSYTFSTIAIPRFSKERSNDRQHRRSTTARSRSGSRPDAAEGDHRADIHAPDPQRRVVHRLDRWDHRGGESDPRHHRGQADQRPEPRCQRGRQRRDLELPVPGRVRPELLTYAAVASLLFFLTVGADPRHWLANMYQFFAPPPPPTPPHPSP